MTHRQHAAGGVGHQQRDGERRDPLRPLLVQLQMLLLEGADAADPGSDDRADPIALVGRFLPPAGVAQRLLRRGERELGEAVGAADLLDAQVLGRLEVGAAPLAVLDSRGAGGPALVKRVGADPEGCYGADARDDGPTGHDMRSATRSTAWPTVLMPSMSSPLILTPHSSSEICASSTRSSESTSSFSNSASRLIWSGSAPNSIRASFTRSSICSLLTVVGICLSFQAVSPPSTVNRAPVTYEASSEARKRTHAAISSGVPGRRAGTASISSSPTPSVSSVSTKPGATALTVTERRATSAATVFVSATSPAFEAA